MSTSTQVEGRQCNTENDDMRVYSPVGTVYENMTKKFSLHSTSPSSEPKYPLLLSFKLFFDLNCNLYFSQIFYTIVWVILIQGTNSPVRLCGTTRSLKKTKILSEQEHNNSSPLSKSCCNLTLNIIKTYLSSIYTGNILFTAKVDNDLLSRNHYNSIM